MVSQQYVLLHEIELNRFVCVGLAAVGLLFQLTNRFGLPFPLNVLFFPLTLLEWFLVRVVVSN
jgi:hypothetical protein